MIQYRKMSQNLASLQVDNWLEYRCKAGEILFYYNKVTSEHKYPEWNPVSKVRGIIFLFSWILSLYLDSIIYFGQKG